MRTCPTCNSQVAVLIVNVQNGRGFCHDCASQECPSFLPNFVLTSEDVRFSQDCGINAEISRIEAAVQGAITERQQPEGKVPS
jgi:hypothetical protein